MNVDVKKRTPAGAKKGYEYYLNLDPKMYKKELCAWYLDKTGRPLNIDSPETFSEKIQWLKLYDTTPLKTRLSDKYLAREWVAEQIGEEYLVPLIGVWERPNDIPFDQLPDRFVLKATHGSGWNIIVQNKSKFNVAAAKKTLAGWLKTDFSFKNGFELCYKDIKPRIICEEYIENTHNDLYDYKVFCFHNKPHFIWMDTQRKADHRRDIFDPAWNLLPFRIIYPNADAPPPRPEALDEMLMIATTLCKGFCHTRVDLYEVRGQVFFGEMTFYSGSGRAPIIPYEYDKIIGDLLTLPRWRRLTVSTLNIVNSLMKRA